MISNLQKGDKIITNGGIKCSVIKTDDNFITVKINDNTIVEIDKLFVAKKIND